MKKILLLVWSVAALCCALAFPAFAADLPQHWNSPPLQEVDAAPLSEVAQPADVAGSCRALALFAPIRRQPPRGKPPRPSRWRTS